MELVSMSMKKNVMEWLDVQETARSLLCRTLSRRVPTFTSVPPLHHVPLHAGHVLEIVGPSGSAKSELLLQAAITCILPKQVNEISCGGSEGVVMMLDLDCRFDIHRLVNVLKLRIHEALVQQGTVYELKWSSNETGDVLRSCLKRFIYMRCYNTYDFLVALKTLHVKIKKLSDSGSQPHLLMIDSINAFYWIERAVSSANSASGRKAFRLQVISEAVVHELSQVLQTYPVLILTTKSLIYAGERTHSDRMKDFQTQEREQKLGKMSNQTSSKPAVSLHTDFMPAVWQGFVTHRLLLQGPFQPESTYMLKDNLPFFTAEWEKPCIQQLDKFIVQNDRIRVIYG